MLLLLLFGGLLAPGLFLLSADALRLPTRSTAAAIARTGKNKRLLDQSVEAGLMSGALRLAKFIKLDAYKRSRMEHLLQAAGIEITPEVYTAYALVKSGVLFCIGLLCLLVLPLLSPVLLILAVLTYFKETRKADEQLREKREQLEGELPRFVATVEQTLKASRDVLALIEAYKKNAGPVFAHELDRLTADMRSSSYEAGLTRFAARLNSPMLSDVVRGLIGVLRGDDSAVYFQMLAHDFKALELQRLKAKAQKIPPKIRIFSFFMLLCFLMTYLVVIALEIMHSLSGMF